MSQKRLSNDEFFTELTTLLTTLANKSHGSIYLTQKPYLPPNSEFSSPSSTPLLIRASNGVSKEARKQSKSNKVKLATVVQPDDLEAFFARYADLCKAGMQGLKKRDRSKKKKEKGKKRKGEGAKA